MYTHARDHIPYPKVIFVSQFLKKGEGERRRARGGRFGQFMHTYKLFGSSAIDRITPLLPSSFAQDESTPWFVWANALRSKSAQSLRAPVYNHLVGSRVLEDKFLLGMCLEDCTSVRGDRLEEYLGGVESGVVVVKDAGANG